MRIPVSFALNGVDCTGWLAPADDHFPPMVCQVSLNGKWMGNLTNADGWRIGPQTMIIWQKPWERSSLPWCNKEKSIVVKRV